ncbi:MAG: hypothetical protein LQ338_005583 [Usnochroma carphineum]|nr:MAG: hypothetical protein LQ338_005583 [Usnochroma carphineum]
MRDGATGRSRGFGFLTFRDPKTVNVVMVKEHYLDGKIVSFNLLYLKLTGLSVLEKRRLYFSKIDPKRAIPRDEQEKTSKIFVGGVSQDATETDFKEYFMQFGRVVDATLMMDKDTGRPRGFGFVTFDSEQAVENTFNGDLMILGKPIEVKKAQPRGNMREDDDSFGGRRGGRRGGKDFRDDRANYNNNPDGNQNQNQNQQNGQGTFAAGMTPQMMAQYWTKMQQYMATFMQQQAAANQMAGGMGMAGMNPAMMQQMAQMQQMQKMQQQMAGRQQGSQSPMPQSPGAQGMGGGMNPAMMQQMQQMQAMQGGGGFPGGPMVPPMPASTPPQGGGFGGRRGTPGYNAQDQLAFEQQKYEQQQARRAAQEAQQMQYHQHGGPTSWEGMYDDVPQPNHMGQHGGGGMGRGGRGGRGGGGNYQQSTPGPQSAPPANAPTGPKNAGKPGANYRGGGHRGAHRGYHPYSRS